MTSKAKTKFLLWGGVLAGPIYILVSAAQILTREGFDITRHSWSLLSNGDLGWVHVINFLVTGTFTVLGAIGIKRSLQNKKSGTWGPIFLMLYGLCLIASGIFKADPVDGFPPGTPLGPPTSVSTSGLLHFVFGGIGFLALIIACIIFYKYFKSLKQKGWARFSLLAGILFFAGFMSIIVGAAFGDMGLTISVLTFTAAVILAWSWYSLLSRHFLRTNSQQ